jgi:DNA-binding protein HU-beta
VNKSQLVDRISPQIDGGRTAATRVVDAVFDAIQEAVSAGEKVTITGFGVFEAYSRAARTGRNPATGEPVEVPAAVVPKFRPGSEFKASVASEAASSGGSKKREARK